MKWLYFVFLLAVFSVFMACSDDDSNNDKDNPQIPDPYPGLLALYSDGGGSETLHYIDPETGDIIEVYPYWTTGVAWDGYHHKIAFSNNYDVFTADPTDPASIQRQTETDSTVQEKNPAFMDGDSILVFTTHRGFYFDGVILKDMQTGALDTIRDLGYQIRNVKVSPSGQFIGYQRTTVQQGVYVMNREGQNQYLSLITGYNNDFDWAGVEDKLAITSDEWIRVPDMVEERTEELLTGTDFNYVAYSPMDDIIAYSKEMDGYSNLYVVNADGSDNRLLLDNSSSGKDIRGLAFDSEGERIAVVERGEDWLYNIDIVDIDTGARENMVEDVGSFTYLRWF